MRSCVYAVIASQRVARMRAPDERNSARAEMTGSAKQSISPHKEPMDCFVASLLAMTMRRRHANLASTLPNPLQLHCSAIRFVIVVP